MSLFQALLLFGNKDEDRSEATFQWARVLTDNAKDADGKPVKNPASIMVYGAKGIAQGDCEDVILISRGIAGLYDLIPADKAEVVLKKMKKTRDQLPTVPLVESTASTKDRATASREARQSRTERRQARAGATAASSVMAEVEQPD